MLTFVLVVLCLILLFYRNDSKKIVSELHKRDKDWVRYLLKYKDKVKTSLEKKLFQNIISDLVGKSIIDPKDLEAILAERALDDNNQINQASSEQALGAEVASGVSNSTVNAKTTDSVIFQSSQLPDQQAVSKEFVKPKTQIDSTTILLYFGAFLFVASVGPFIAFGGTNGWARTVLVLVMAMCFYWLGQWIYKTKPILKSAGLSFVGIGIVLMPMVGLAAYNFVYGISARTVWFIASLLCLALYAHALVTIRKPLLNYIFIFTLLSVFESGVAIIQLPIYYFGWIMIGCGLLLQAISTWKNIWPDFKDSTKEGSQLYVPISLVVSLVVVGSQGVGQLGVTLLLGALYYGLEAWRATADYEYRKLTTFIAHLSVLAGLSCLFYGFSKDISLVGWSLVGLTLVQVAIVMKWRNNSEIIKNVASVMLLSCVTAMIMLAGNYEAMTIILAILVVESLFIWLWQKRDDAYILATSSWMVLPNLWGLFAIKPQLQINSLISLNIIALVVQVALFVLVFRPKSVVDDSDTGRQTLLLQTILVSIIVCFATPVVTLLSLSAISLILLVLSILDKVNNNTWEVISGLVISLAVIRGWQDPVLLASIMVALAFNILLALRFRSEINRWVSTVLWLLLPIGLGGLTTINIWGPTVYAWSYLMVMAGLVVSRAIARGVVFASNNIPLLSYARSSSESYVFGYIVAGSLALMISLFSAQSQFNTTVIAVILSLVIFFLALWVEKDPDLNTLQPMLFQIILISAIRPSSEGEILVFFALLSSAVAVTCYLTALSISDALKPKLINSEHIKQVAIITSLITPLSVLYAQNANWTMPVGLVITGLLLFDFWRNTKQVKKEIAVSVITIGLMWLLEILGVHNIQAHTHILAIMFAGFAYWRYTIGDLKQTDSYIYYALAISTIPLALQAISSDSGGVYGWWLLLEQVMFMIIGGIIHKRFVVMWGMYVAVGAVLFQLRDLSILAMIFLALFVNGVAIYKLQKSGKSK